MRLTVTDPRGQSLANTVSLDASSILGGTKGIPLGARVYLNGGAGPTYNWTLTPPAGSGITLDNATIRTPNFKATAAGTYTAADNVSGRTMTLTVGTFAGLMANGTITGNLLFDGVATDISNTNGSCQACHSGGVGGNQLPTWVKTRHAKILAQNLTTAADLPGEGRTCIYCHSVGYDEGALGNGGFAAKMYAFDNLFFPYGVSFGGLSTFWTDLFATPQKAAMAALGNIQCENCHGPNNAAHTATQTTNEFLSPRISFSAEVCAQCHGRTSHNYYSQWATLSTDNTGHASRSRALAEGVGSQASCARCHSAQGFTVYLDQLADNNIGYLNNAQIASKEPIDNITANNVEPITCTACHDPHNVQYLFNADGTRVLLPSSGANPDGTPRPQRQATNSQLRIYNDTPQLPSGFKVTGFGKGAICVTCHNSRRGLTTDNTVGFLHEDTDATPFANWESWGTPHASAKGDSFAGRNAYFMGTSLPMISKHAAVEGTCAGCHMRLNPNKIVGELGNTSQSHRWVIDESQLLAFCSNCHGEDSVNGEALKAATLAGLSDLKDKMSAQMLSYLNAKGADVIKLGDNTAVASTITSATYSPTATGGVRFNIKWTGGPAAGVNANLYPTTATSTGAFIQNADDNTFVFSPSSNMWKAAWNYSMVLCDGTLGIHNPGFTQAVINNTRGQDLTLNGF